MATMTIRAAKANLAKLIARAEAGEEIIIARGRKPAARLLPMHLSNHVLRARTFGAFKGRLDLPDSFFFDPLSEEELKRWEGVEE